jgi:hypothetical protein
MHKFDQIARSAAACLVRLKGAEAFAILGAKIDDSLRKGNAETLANALRYAEIEHFQLANLF